MQALQIKGKARLGGEIDVHGAKNSALPILAATVLINGESVIHNCPMLSDVVTAIEILESLGAEITIEKNTVIVNSRNIHSYYIPEKLMHEMRSSIIFLGALAARMGKACMFLPGGCEIGLRPIDLHLKALKSLGYSVCFDGNNICADNENAKAQKIVLSFPSVGATENSILAAVGLPGRTTIINAAREPEITDLIHFLNSAGAKITGASTPVIEIEGVSALSSTEHTVIPDRICAATYMSAAAVTSNTLKINRVLPSHLAPVFPVFSEMGCKIYLEKNAVILKPPKRLKRVKCIQTQPYPGFPTDCQSLVMVPLTVAGGTSVVEETIFESRYKHIAQLNRFGADICVRDCVAIINGVRHLHGTTAHCTDLRGGAAVVLEALAAEGSTTIKDIFHIDRGYENFEQQLSSIGADIKRINYEEEKTKP